MNNVNFNNLINESQKDFKKLFESNDWGPIKLSVLDDIKKAGITDKILISKILKFERSINSLRNRLLRKHSWNAVRTSIEADNADDLLQEFYTKYENDFRKYCKEANYFWDFNIGDILS